MIAKKVLTIPAEVTQAAQIFESAEQSIKNEIFPILKEQGQPAWQCENSGLLNLVVDGSEISHRLSLYAEIGHITPPMARQTCHRIELYLESLLNVMDRIEDDAEQQNLLKQLSTSAIGLLHCMRRLRPCHCSH